MAKASDLSQTTISRIWRAFALQPRRSQTFKLSKDPLFVERVPVQTNGTAALIDNLHFVGVGAVPEPSAAVLYGVGLLVAGTALRRRTIAA